MQNIPSALMQAVDTDIELVAAESSVVAAVSISGMHVCLSDAVVVVELTNHAGFRMLM